MGHKRLPEDKVIAILKGLFVENKGCTQLALEVLGRKSRESSIRHIKNVYEKYGNYFGVSLDGDDVVSQHQIKNVKLPKILVLDIETSTTLSEHFGTFKVNIGLDAIRRDWCVLSWAAKWWDCDEVEYMDIRKQFDGTAESILREPDDKSLLTRMWELLNEADIVVSQNGVKFDIRKLNSRMVMQGMKPYSPVKHIDTLLIAKKHFGFTSNKLSYMTDKLCKKYKKLDHSKFAGQKLWLECIIGNSEAWDELEEYNCYDVLSLQELAGILAPWSNSLPNLDLYHETQDNICLCGNDTWEHAGFSYTGLSKFNVHKCTNCGYHKRDRVNLHNKEKMKTLRMNVA